MNVSELAGRSPPSGYCQYIPPRDAGGCHFVRHGPPALPPHLLQSVLNADLPEHVSCSFSTCLLSALQFFWLYFCQCDEFSEFFLHSVDGTEMALMPLRNSGVFSLAQVCWFKTLLQHNPPVVDMVLANAGCMMDVKW